MVFFVSICAQWQSLRQVGLKLDIVIPTEFPLILKFPDQPHSQRTEPGCYTDSEELLLANAERYTNVNILWPSQRVNIWRMWWTHTVITSFHRYFTGKNITTFQTHLRRKECVPIREVWRTWSSGGRVSGGSIKSGIIQKHEYQRQHQHILRLYNGSNTILRAECKLSHLIS